MTYNNRPIGAYSRRYSNAAVVNPSGETFGTSGGSTSTHYTVFTTANDRSMGDVKITLVNGSYKDPVIIGTTTQSRYTRYSNFTPASGTQYAAGTQIRVTAQAAPGYKFVSWASADCIPAGCHQDPSFVVTVNGNMTFKAQFEKLPESFRTVKVSWDARFGKVVPSGSINLTNGGGFVVRTGDSVTLIAQPFSDCNFVRWEGVNIAGNVQSNTSPTITLAVSSDLNLTAVFTKDNPSSGDNPPGNGDPNDPNETPNSGGGGGGGGTVDPITGSISGNGSTDLMTQALAFVKKWWWALLIAGYLIYDKKGGSK